MPSFTIGIAFRKVQAIFRASNPKNRLGNTPRGFPPSPFPQGGNSCFPHNKADFCVSKKRKEENEVFLKPFALAVAFCAALPRVRRFAPSASGGLKPFSEEKGFKTSKKTLVASRKTHSMQKPALFVQGGFDLAYFFSFFLPILII